MFPQAAAAIYVNYPIAAAETIARFPILGNGRNNQSDAFRHCFFNAMNSRDTMDAVARLFSDAHESEVPPNLDLEVQMDKFNNYKGHLIGMDAAIDVPDSFLADIAFNLMLNGTLVMLAPLDPYTIGPPNHGITDETTLVPTF